MGCNLPDDWELRGQAAGGSTSPLEKYANFLLTLIEGQPDLTLDEVVSAMRKHKIWQSHRSMALLSAPQDHVQKKPERGGAGARRRGAGVAALDARTGMFDAARLVFIDETSANTKMMRLHGRCVRGERLVDHVPQGHWKTITFVAALRRHGMKHRRPLTAQ